MTRRKPAAAKAAAAPAPKAKAPAAPKVDAAPKGPPDCTDPLVTSDPLTGLETYRGHHWIDEHSGDPAAPVYVTRCRRCGFTTAREV